MDTSKAIEFPVAKAKAAAKKCPKIVQEYIHFLEKNLVEQYRISALAVAKMRELAAIEKQAREMLKNEPN